jgi:flagellar motor component MotA
MKRYWLSVLILAVGFLLIIYMSGSTIGAFIDIPSLVIVIVTPLLFVTILFGVKEMRKAFTILRKKENDHGTLLKALTFFKFYSMATWFSAIISIFSGGIGILSNLDDRYSIGPNFALVLISLFYCGLVHLAIVMPHKVFIHKQFGNDSRIPGDKLSLFCSMFGIVFVLLLQFIILVPV